MHTQNDPPKPEGCPEAEELARFCIGKLSNDRLEAIAVHLGDCPGCESRMQQLGRESDVLVEALRHPREATTLDDEDRSRVTLLVEEIVRTNLPDRTAATRLRADGTPVQPGSDRIGQYRLLAKVGQGGMGVVYKALHHVLGKVVALKVLTAKRTENAESIRRFYREMKAVGKLQHPNIVAAHDAGEVEGVHYLTMEFVEGLNLSMLLKQHGPLRTADACELVRQAAEGLEHAHEHGLVHRDLKPSNLMLSKKGEVKVLDLGLALLQAEDYEAESLTATDQAGIGTADYMAPEQIGNAHGVDIRADIYSLGCTLYQLLTGRAPFSGPQYVTTMQKAYAHVNQPATPIGKHRADVPPALGVVIARMLAKSPDDRFASPAKLAAALAPFASGANLLALLSEEGIASDTARTQEIDESKVETAPFCNSSDTSPRASRRMREIATRHPMWLTGCGMIAILAGVGLWHSSGPLKVEPEEPKKPVVPRPGAKKKVLLEESDRDVAEWVLGLDGGVSVYSEPGKLYALKKVAQLPAEPFKLYAVTLSNNDKLTDDGLKNLAQLKRLGSLFIRDTQISDAGLVHLRGVKTLLHLEIQGTRVTDEGVKSLQQALPQCKIMR
jgi:serine/threonine protein kinase